MSESNDSTNTNHSNVIDPSNPLFLGSTDSPNSILVSNVFNGVGFSAWKSSMIISLSAKNKLGFVDGTIVQPSVTSSSYSNWHRVNSMVISWILNSLGKNIADSVLFLQTAHEIWKELNHRFEQSDGTMIYQIQQQLYSLSQGSDDFTSYFAKLSKIWDELRIVQSLPECSCGTAAGIHKFLEEQRLIQLLMGLNDSYRVIRGQILMMKPLPTVATAYSLIIQEERQRDIQLPSNFINDAAAMHVFYITSNNSNKKSLVCNHCKKTGHTRAQCYRLVGFPSTFKFTKNKKEDVKSTVQNVVSHPNITNEQYQNLMNMLQSLKGKDENGASSGHVNSVYTMEQ